MTERELRMWAIEQIVKCNTDIGANQLIDQANILVKYITQIS